MGVTIGAAPRLPREVALPPGEFRAEIVASWRRTTRCGLTPDARLADLPIADVDRSSRLIRAATPVLDRMTTELADSRFSVMLADRTGRIVDQRFGMPSVRTGLENVGGVIGRQFVEESTGTNGVATVLETRRGVAVHAGEHFIEAMQAFSCYGHPLFDRITGRLIGVLDITCPRADRTGLMAPLLTRAAEAIELRLIQHARPQDQQLLAAFRAASRRDDVGVVGFGTGITLTNEAARRALEPADLSTLAGLAGTTTTEDVRVPLALASGRAATARIRRAGPLGGALVDIDVEPIAAGGRQESAVRPGATLVSGEPGSGRTTRAALLLGADPVVIDAAGRAVPIEEVAAALDGSGDVLLESYDRLTPAVAHRLAGLLRSARARVVLTTGPLTSLGDEHLAVAARCPTTIELPPLRHRLGELARLAGTMLAGIRDDVRLGPDALPILLSQPWPGNLTQLRTVLVAAAARGTAIITPDELPDSIRARPRRALSLIEQSERATIQYVLDKCGSNYRAAARLLDISPTTLYRKTRLYGL
jgi:transcriptional regulator of acetoin/glycerol metabolism